MIRNFGWAVLNHGVGRGAIFLFFLALPWLMEVDDVGRLTFTYTILLLVFQPILDTAIGTVIVKYTAREGWSNVLGAVRFLGVALIVSAIGVAIAASFAPRQTGVVLLLGGVVLGAIALNAVFAWRRGLQDFRMEGIVGGFQKVLALIVLIVFAYSGLTGPAAAASALAVGIAGAWFLACTVFRAPLRQFVQLVSSRPIDTAPTATLLREGVVLGAVGVIGLLYLRIDVVMLGLISGDSEVGFYFTAARIVEASFIIPHIVMLVVFPKLAQSVRNTRILKRTTVGLGLAGIVATLALAAVGRWIIPRIYGHEWHHAGEILTLLGLAAPAVFLGYVLTQTLVARDLQERFLAVAAAGLALNIGLNLVLIPHFGGLGAAGATVLTEGVVSAGAALALLSGRRFVPAPRDRG